MKTFLLFTLIAFFCTCTAGAQIGPKVYDKNKPDSTKTEEKAEEPKKPESKPDKPVPKPQAAKPEEKTASKEKAAPQEKPAPKEKLKSSPNLKRAVFTTAMEDREPVGKIDSLSTDVDQVYFFTEVVGLAGKTVIHRWKYKGETQAEVHVAVGGPRWRFYSSKKFLPSWTGEWIVDILDGDGNVLGTKRLIYFDGSPPE